MSPQLFMTLAAVGYAAFFVLALVSPFLPTFLMWRTAGLSLVALTAANLLDGPAHWDDKTAGYVLATGLALLFFGFIALAIMIRLIISGLRKKLNDETITGPDSRLRIHFDKAALTATGCTAGLVLTIFLARLLSGVPLGQSLDMGIAVAAAVCVVVLFLRKKRVAVASSAALTTLAALAMVGSFQSDRIVDAAEARANGQAWCLTGASRRGPITHMGQLGFFGLAKGGSDPHLSLYLGSTGGLQWAGNWSIRQQRFVEGRVVRGRHRCRPIVDFATALENGTVESR